MRARSTLKQQWGDKAEQLACDFLEKRHLRLVARNYRCRAGEIDLVMCDRDIWVFVEVRYRRSQRFGSAADSVNYAKQQRLIRAAHHYLQGRCLAEKVPCRFDIVALQSGLGELIDIEWIQNAFEER